MGLAGLLVDQIRIMTTSVGKEYHLDFLILQMSIRSGRGVACPSPQSPALATPPIARAPLRYFKDNT